MISLMTEHLLATFVSLLMFQHRTRRWDRDSLDSHKLIDTDELGNICIIRVVLLRTRKHSGWLRCTHPCHIANHHIESFSLIGAPLNACGECLNNMLPSISEVNLSHLVGSLVKDPWTRRATRAVNEPLPYCTELERGPTTLISIDHGCCAALMLVALANRG